MKKTLFLIVILWVSVIGWFSNQSLQSTTHQTHEVLQKLNIATETELVRSGSDEIKLIKFITRKSAHFLLFFILGGILTAGLYFCYKLEGKALILQGWGIGSVIGVTDEIHQFFIPGRAMQLKDMVIDSVGVLVGVLLAVWLLQLIFESSNDYRNEYGE